jgi:hypothetical protein
MTNRLFMRPIAIALQAKQRSITNEMTSTLPPYF